MKRIYVVTEGQSETNFVNRVLVPYFFGSQKILIPTTILTKADEQKGKMYKGGYVELCESAYNYTKRFGLYKRSECLCYNNV